MRLAYYAKRLCYLAVGLLGYKIFSWMLVVTTSVQEVEVRSAAKEPLVARHPATSIQDADPKEPGAPISALPPEYHLGFDPSHPKNILLLAYQRSGSTFIGNVLLMNNPDVFYIYEPLDGPFCAMYGTQPGMNIPDDINNFENGSHREPPAYEVDVMRKTLLDTFHCNTTSHPVQMKLHKFWQYFSRNMVKIEPYAHCLSLKRMTYRSVERCRGHIRKICGKRFYASNSTTNVCLQRLWFRKTVQDPALEMKFTKYEKCLNNIGKHLSQCSPLPDKACAATKVRAIKTVRATMETVRPFFRDVPNFRVIHLIRDPRAAVASKRRLWWAQGLYASEDIGKEAMIYCQQISLDLASRRQLEQEYPGQIMELLYDDFVQRPQENFRRVHDFLELDLHNVTKQKMLKATANSTANANKWQSQLTYLEVRDIERYCKDVFEKVNFP